MDELGLERGVPYITLMPRRQWQGLGGVSDGLSGVAPGGMGGRKHHEGEAVPASALPHGH